MKAKMIVNPYCIVNYFHWLATNEHLDCRECPMDCPCKIVTVIE